MCVSLTLVFSFHLQQWAAVMEELVYSTTPCVDDDDYDDDDDHGCYVDEENWKMVKKSRQSPTLTRFAGQAWPLAADIDACTLILSIIETMTNNNVITILFTMIRLYLKK